MAVVVLLLVEFTAAAAAVLLLLLLLLLLLREWLWPWAAPPLLWDTNLPAPPHTLPSSPGCYRRAQTIIMSFVVGTLFLQETTGLQGTNLSASLTSANNFLGVLFFTCINL